MRTLSFTIPPALARKTVKAALRQELHMANSLISRVKLRETGILLNGERVHTNHIVQTGDILTVEIGDLPTANPVEPIEIPFEVLWEDADLLILNKPAGIAVHGAAGKDRPPTLLNALAYYLGPEQIVHPVNRLDRGTSGVMVIAKNSYIHDRLRLVLHSGQFFREYRGIAVGNVNPACGTIDLPIGRAADSLVKRQITPDGLPAQTMYETLSRQNGFTLLRIFPQTGRTHQIRLHFAAIGFPLVGDWLYGTENQTLIPRPALHSFALQLIHPLTGKEIRVQAPLPDDMQQLLMPE